MIHLKYLQNNIIELTNINNYGMTENKTVTLEKNGMTELVNLINSITDTGDSNLLQLILKISDNFHDFIINFSNVPQKGNLQAYLDISQLTNIMDVEYLAKQIAEFELYRIISMHTNFPSDNILPKTHPLYNKLYRENALDLFKSQHETASRNSSNCLGGWNLGMEYEKITCLISHYCFNFFFLPIYDITAFSFDDYTSIITCLDSFLEKRLFEYKLLYEINMGIWYTISPDEAKYNWCSPSHLTIRNKKWTHYKLKEHLESFNNSNYLNQLYLDLLSLMALNENFLPFEDEHIAHNGLRLTFQNLNLDFPEYNYSVPIPPEDFSPNYKIESIQQIIFHICSKLSQSGEVLYKCPICKRCYNMKHKNKFFCSTTCRVKNHIENQSPHQKIIQQNLHKLASLHSKRQSDYTQVAALSDDDYKNIYGNLEKTLLAIEQNIPQEDFKEKADVVYKTFKDEYISTASKQTRLSQRDQDTQK